MAQIIGQDVEVAVSKESVRMTGVAPSSGDWVQRGELSIKPVKQTVDIVVNEGRLTTRREVKAVHFEAEVSITMPVDRKHVAKFLMGYYGNVDTDANTPESGVHTHNLEILHTGYVPSYTINVIRGAKQFRYAGGVVTSVKLALTPDAEPKITVTYLTKKEASTTGMTASYPTTSYYSPVDVKVYLPNSYASIATANELDVRELNIEWTREAKKMKYLGNDSYSNVIVADFDMKGTLVKDYNEEEYVSGDTAYAQDDARNHVTRALRVVLEDSATTIGASTNPSITIDIPALKLVEYEDNDALKEIVGESYDLLPFDNGTDDMSVAVVVTDVATV